jgi:hypothetical protein
MPVKFIHKEVSADDSTVSTGAASIRKRTRINTKYKRLKALEPVQYLEMENMLLSGESPVNVARHMRKDWRVFPDIKEATVIQLIKRFKAEVIAPRLVTSQGDMKTKGGKALSRSMCNINIAEEYENLLVMQKKRLESILQREEILPTLLDSVGKEIRLMNDLLKGFTNFKLSAGMLTRVNNGDPLVQMNVVNQSIEFGERNDSHVRQANAAALLIETLSPTIIDI